MKSPEILIGIDGTGRRVLTHAEAETITQDELVQRARALIPVLRGRAMLAEELRTLPAETIADFHAAGFFRICQPKRFGGFELGMEALQAVLVEIGRGCASSAWVLGILTGHAWWASQFPEAGQVEMFGDDGVALLPTGIFGRGGRRRRSRAGTGYRGAGRTSRGATRRTGSGAARTWSRRGKKHRWACRSSSRRRPGISRMTGTRWGCGAPAARPW